MGMRELKKYEKLMIISILILSLSSLGFMLLSKNDLGKSNVLIIVGNQVVNKVPMNYGTESKTYEFEFKSHLGQMETGYIELQNGKVRMREMNNQVCPHGICSETGWIETTYQSIICLPNQIIVRIEKEQTDEGPAPLVDINI